MQVQLEFDPALRVDAREIADLWASDPEARAVLDGPPEVRRRRPSTYLPGMVEFVVLPLAVNVASTILVELSARIYRRYRPGDGGAVDTTAEDGSDGDRVIVTKPAEPEEAPREEPQE